MEHLKGRKYALERKEIEKFLDKIEKLGNDLMVLLK